MQGATLKKIQQVKAIRTRKKYLLLPIIGWTESDIWPKLTAYKTNNNKIPQKNKAELRVTKTYLNYLDSRNYYTFKAIKNVFSGLGNSIGTNSK